MLLFTTVTCNSLGVHGKIHMAIVFLCNKTYSVQGLVENTINQNCLWCYLMLLQIPNNRQKIKNYYNVFRFRIRRVIRQYKHNNNNCYKWTLLQYIGCPFSSSSMRLIKLIRLRGWVKILRYINGLLRFLKNAYI